MDELQPHAIVEREDKTIIITMNRPHRKNALSPAMMFRMLDAYEEASNNPDISSIIVTGANNDFCSGADLRAMSGDSGDPDPDWPSEKIKERMKVEDDLMMKALLRHYRPTKPIIAAVEGVCIAGGTEMLQAMDIRVTTKTAKFGVSEARWSLYPMAGSAVRLRRQIPYAHAADILLTGKHITGEEAHQIGLVSRLVPENKTLDEAKSIAKTIGENGPLAVEAILRTLHETDGMEEKLALAHEFEYGMEVFNSEDSKEGPLAFSEKRKPVFKRK